MRRARIQVALFGVIVAITAACSGSVDTSKYEDLYRAGKNIEGALGVGVNLIRYRELLQQLATEVSIASDKASSKAEREMVAAYAEALTAFKDAETIWAKSLGEKSEMSSIDDDVFRIVGEYPISGTGTGRQFSFMPKQAVQTIWTAAGNKLRVATALYNNQDPDEV